MSNLTRIARSSAAAYRRIERSQQQKAREASRQFKSQQKQEAILDASRAVAEYNNYIKILTSVHKEATDAVNWDAILSDPPPASPLPSKDHEEYALKKEGAYKPGFLDKIFGLELKKRQKLRKQVEEAKRNDDAAYNKKIKQFETDTADYNSVQAIGQGIKQNEITAYRDAIEFFAPYSDIAELGTHVNLTFDPNYVIVELMVNDQDDIPDYVLSQTSTGKLSKKNMPAGRFNEIYQDYVCSCVLRVARETLAYLPVNYVVINAMGTLFDTTTGHADEKTILSVVISPEKLDKLNLDTVDPSDSMKNFIHHMQFNKTKGFSGVTQIRPETLIH